MIAVVDRIEGNNAVLIIAPDNQVLTVIKSDLPKNIHEGDTLTISFTVDRDITNKKRERIRKMIDQLDNK